MKTKTFLTAMLIAYCILPTAANAQLPTAQEQDNNYKWSFSAAINSAEAQIGNPQWGSWGYATFNYNGINNKTDKSMSFSIIPKYYIKNNLLLRFEFSITNFNLSTYSDDSPFFKTSTGLTITNASIKQNIYRFIPGIQKPFFKDKNVELYGGMTVDYLNYSKMNYIDNYDAYYLPSNLFANGYNDKVSFTGGYALGGGAFLGFNVFFYKHISMGAEFSTALLYYKLGGELNGLETTQNGTNPPATSSLSYSTSIYKGFQFSKVLSSFNISFLL